MRYLDCIEKLDGDTIVIHLPTELMLENEMDNPIFIMSHELTRTGAPLQLYNLVFALKQLKYQVVMCSLYDGDLLEDFLALGIPVCILTNVTSEKWLDKVIEVFDTVIVNTLVLSYIVRYLAPKAGRLFWWIHENSYMYNANLCANIPNVPSLHILAASPKIKKFINKYLNRNSDVLNVCVNDHGLGKAENVETNIFLWAGSLDVNKSVETFLQAILELPEQERNASDFYLCVTNTSNKEHYDYLQKFSESLPNIHIMENVPHNELLEMMNLVDAVVVSSREETTSMVAVEGLMKGKIVICSDGCGVTAFLEDEKNALIFPSGNVLEICKKMQFVIHNKVSLDEIKNNARKVYEQNYSFELFLHTLNKLLENSKDIID